MVNKSLQSKLGLIQKMIKLLFIGDIASKFEWNKYLQHNTLLKEHTQDITEFCELKQLVRCCADKADKVNIESLRNFIH